MCVSVISCPDFFRMPTIQSRGDALRAKFKKCDDFTEKFRGFHRTFLYLNRQLASQIVILNPEHGWSSFWSSFVILTRSVDVPDPCENWALTPVPKRITLDACDTIKPPVMYA